ncbi:hypothetical protein AB833_01255 [Chromatiales bacterium (ex Bugula neritina AB1)]|nr:hypothetical protein AB833_01255 [Chromatiales bacterium (ex Bugula neritina AB1)]
MKSPSLSLVHLFFLTYFVAFSGLSFADMRINKSIVNFYPDDLPRQDIEVSNISNKALYLQVEVKEVLNPGTSSQKSHSSIKVEDVEFLASPAKSIVAPGGKRKVRLMNLGEPGDSERVYRVTFRPIPVETEAEKSMVQVLVAYQTLVIVRPKQIEQKIIANRSDKSLILQNRGNSNVLLQAGKMCQSKNQCTDLPAKRLYPGNELLVSLDHSDSDVHYTLNYGRSGLEERLF